MTFPVHRTVPGKKKVAFAAGSILVLFVSVLLVMHYRSQVLLRQTATDQVVYFLERQADALSYFYSERKMDLQTISRAREIRIYFENKALGMSMAYGLKASLDQINREFDYLIGERKAGGIPIYQRVVFINEKGTLLVDRRNPGLRHDCELPWSRFLTPNIPEPRVSALSHDDHFHVLATVPFFFKGRFQGQIVAMISPGAFFDLLKKNSHIDFGLAEIPAVYPEPDPLLLNQIRSHPSGTVFRFSRSGPGLDSKPCLGIRLPIPETGFSLITALPAADVTGRSAPENLLVTMIILAVFITGTTFGLWQMNTRSQVLQARLEQENIHKTAIQEKNRELEEQIRLKNILDQRLAESEEKFRTMAMAAQDAIIMVDNQGDIAFWNRSAVKIFGYTIQEALHRNCRDITVPARYHDVYDSAFARFQAKGDGPAVGRTLEVKAVRKKGKEFPVEISLSSIKLEGRWQAIAIVRDISLRKENDAELRQYRKNLEQRVRERTEELEQAQKKLVNQAVEAGRAQLSAMILHNIGNAVTPSCIHLELYEKDKGQHLAELVTKCCRDLLVHRQDLTTYVNQNPRGKTVIEYLQTLADTLGRHQEKTRDMIQEIAAGIGYVAEILSLYQSYAPGRKEICQQVSLNAMVEDALTIQKTSVINRNIRVEKDLAPELPAVTAEKNKVMQVIVNLIRNSCDAIDQAGQTCGHVIAICTYARGNLAGLQIRDTGIGIAGENLKKIFEFGESTKGSSGFGLYYCKSVIEGSGGTLTLDSPGPDQGAVATLELPLSGGG